MLNIKSKAFAGLMVGLALFVGAAVLTASADTINLPSTGVKKTSGATVIKSLQSFLNWSLGTSITPLVVDGKWGAKTTAGIKAYQAANGLAVDGSFGKLSAAKAMAIQSGTVNNNANGGCSAGQMFNPNTGASCTNNNTTVQTGPVTATLASDTPASAYVIGNQATADLAHFAFTGNGTVNSVTLHRTGISDQNTLTNVYLYNGMTRLTDGYSFNNSGDIVMNNLGITVNGTMVISVKADIAANAGASNIGVTLVNFTNGTTVNTVNIAGNLMTYGTGSLASVYLATAASVAVPAATVNAGTSAYTVWSAPIQVNTRKVMLKGANFRMVGSAPANALTNIKLYVDGVDTGAVATVGSITGTNYAMFNFLASPISLTTGSHTVDLRADISSGASYDVTVSIQQAADFVIYDPQVGVNIAPAVSSTVAFSSNSAGKISIGAGTASVVVDPAFQAMSNITGGATNTTIARFKVHGYGEDVKVTSLNVTPVLINATAGANSINGSSVCTGTCGLNNVTVYFNGSQVGGSSFNWTSGSHTFTLGSQMILPAGADSMIEIRADLQTTGGTNYTAGTISANLTTGTSYGQGQSSHSTLDFPTSSITGTTLSIQTGVLAVSKNTGYSNQSVTPNTANVKIGSFTLQNQSSSESVRVTTLTVAMARADGTTALTNTGSAGVYPALTNFANLKTSETTGSGSTPVQPTASNTFSVNFTMLPGTTKTIDVYADTSSTAASETFSTNLVVTSVGSSSTVSISQNSNGTAVPGQVITLAVGTLGTSPSLLTASSTSQQFVPAGTSGVTDATLATFNLTSANGASTVSEMKFTVNGQDASTLWVSGGTPLSTGSQASILVTTGTGSKFAIGDVVQLMGTTSNGIGTITAISTDTLTIYENVAPVGFVAGTTAAIIKTIPATVTNIRVGTVNASPVNGTAYLTGLNLSVPNGGAGLNVPVYISYAPVGTNGVISGATSRVALEYIKYNGGNSTTTLATTAVGGTGLTAKSAPTMKLVASSPSISVLPSSSVTNGALSPGTVEVGDIMVTATKGSIVLKALPISLNLVSAVFTSTLLNGLIVKDANGNPITTKNSVFGATTGGTSTIYFVGGYQVDTTQTFKVYAPISATTFNGSGPVAHSASVTFGLDAAYTSATQGLIWTDLAGNASATTSVDVAAGVTYDSNDSFTTTGNETTISNARLDRTNAPGFFYNYPTTTVSLSS